MTEEGVDRSLPKLSARPPSWIRTVGTNRSLLRVSSAICGVCRVSAAARAVQHRSPMDLVQCASHALLFLFVGCVVPQNAADGAPNDGRSDASTSKASDPTQQAGTAAGPAAGPSSATASPAGPGSDGSSASPAPITTATKQVSVDSTTTVPVDVYAPTAGGPYPLVVLRHGLTRSKEQLAGWGQDLASHGFVAVLPDARVSWRDDAEGDARDMLTVMKWALVEPSLAGKVDPTRRILGGHSSGGLAAIVAASLDPSLKALLLLDTEGDDLGVTAGAKVSMPTLGIFGEPDTLCNESGTGVGSFQAVTGPRFGMRIRGASHCDAESPSSAGCELPCGATTPNAQGLYRQFGLAFLDAYVNCNAASFAAVDPHAQAPAGVEIFSADNRGAPASVCGK
jgi:hypothetical protein